MTCVLFVDDEPHVLAGLRRMLRSRQGAWDLRFVEDARIALEVMEREPVDVIVSDFRMPGLDGGQLLAEARRRHPEVARLILSGHTDEGDLMRVVTVAHQFLSKPTGPEELIGALDRALRLRDELGGEQIRAEVSGLEAFPSPPTPSATSLMRWSHPTRTPAGSPGSSNGTWPSPPRCSSWSTRRSSPPAP